VKFIATDVFGRTVIGSLAAWSHAERGHPEMVGREDQVKVAIEQPAAVHEGNAPGILLFRGQTITAGFWKNSFPVAVVEYIKSGNGYMRTAYLSTLDPSGAQIWPPP
jgi:long-subunit acyl-CoA synthetase (AMP-forming)